MRKSQRKKSQKKSTLENRRTTRRLAAAVAEKFLAHALDSSSIFDEADDEWRALSDHLEQTRCAYITDPEHRGDASDKHAMFEVGRAVGRLEGGAR